MEREPEVKALETYNLKLTKFELLHIRDLFSVVLPPDGSHTVSEALAAIENRSIPESKVWMKIAALCKEANLPVDDEAPDYIVAPTAPPPMTVFQLQNDIEGPQQVGALEKLFQKAGSEAEDAK